MPAEAVAGRLIVVGLAALGAAGFQEEFACTQPSFAGKQNIENFLTVFFRRFERISSEFRAPKGVDYF